MSQRWTRRPILVAMFCSAYYLLRWAFSAQSEGLLTPENSVAMLPLLLGIFVLVLRLIGFFVLLPIGAYWFVSGVLFRAITKAPPIAQRGAR